MRIGRAFAAGFGLAALAAGGYLFTGGTAPGQAPDKKEVVEPAVAEMAKEFIAAFDKGDAKALAALWTADGDYYDQTGRHTHGRPAIEKMYAKFFAAEKGAKLSLIVTHRKKLGPDVLVEDGVSEVAPADGSAPVVARFTTILVRADGKWLVESVRESGVTAAAHSEHFDDLEWLIGEWAGEAEKGESARATYEWADGGNFIVATFAKTHNGAAAGGGTQWIGYDPAAKAIRSWTFYTAGGFGEGAWSKTDAGWAVKSTTTTADGKKVTVTNTISRTGPDAATLQPTGLTIDGKAAPDGPALKLKRVKADR